MISRILISTAFALHFLCVAHAAEPKPAKKTTPPANGPVEPAKTVVPGAFPKTTCRRSRL